MSGHGPEGHSGGHDAPKHESHSHGGGVKGVEKVGSKGPEIVAGVAKDVLNVVQDIFGLSGDKPH